MNLFHDLVPDWLCILLLWQLTCCTDTPKNIEREEVGFFALCFRELAVWLWVQSQKLPWQTQFSQDSRMHIIFHYFKQNQIRFDKSSLDILFQQIFDCLLTYRTSYPGWIKLHVVTCHTFPLGRSAGYFHILGGGEYSANEKSKCQVCLNFNFRGGGVLCHEKSQSTKIAWACAILGGYSATEKSQSAKICLNFNFRGGGYVKNHKVLCLNFNGGGGVCATEKSQSLPISIFWGGVFGNWKITKCQDLPKFQFLRGGILHELTKCQDLPKFQFSGGGIHEKSQRPRSSLTILGGVFCNWKITKCQDRLISIFAATEKSKVPRSA